MARKIRKEIRWAQNFLVGEKTVRRLVAAGSIGKEDLVVEIGAGGGILTAELARIARRVVALEIDPALACALRDRFRGVSNVEIRTEDFLRCRIEERKYKIFANIPFNRTAEIVRKILRSVPAPEDAFLVMQKEAAEKFCGCPKETRFSVLAKPFFQMRIVQALHRTDFFPVPGIDSVLLRIRRREAPLVPAREMAAYRRFVSYAFGVWKPNMKLTLKRVFSHRQWKFVSRNLRISPDAAPSELDFGQWLGLFEFLKQSGNEGKFRRPAERERKLGRRRRRSGGFFPCFPDPPADQVVDFSGRS